MITFGTLLLASICLIWFLLISGLLWKLIVAAAGWFGMHVLLLTYFPDSAHQCIVISGYNFSWAQVIPSVIVLLAMAYTRE